MQLEAHWVWRFKMTTHYHDLHRCLQYSWKEVPTKEGDVDVNIELQYQIDSQGNCFKLSILSQVVNPLRNNQPRQWNHRPLETAHLFSAHLAVLEPPWIMLKIQTAVGAPPEADKTHFGCHGIHHSLSLTLHRFMLHCSASIWTVP